MKTALLILSLIISIQTAFSQSRKQLKANTIAPEFTITDVNGDTIRLADLRPDAKKTKEPSSNRTQPTIIDKQKRQERRTNR